MPRPPGVPRSGPRYWWGAVRPVRFDFAPDNHDSPLDVMRNVYTCTHVHEDQSGVLRTFARQSGPFPLPDAEELELLTRVVLNLQDRRARELQRKGRGLSDVRHLFGYRVSTLSRHRAPGPEAGEPPLRVKRPEQ
jgi:hypothetical protein